MRRLSVLATLCAAALIAGSQAPAAADRRDKVPDDEPLPGYTVDNPPLPPLEIGGEPTRVLQGVHEHAAYEIEIPPSWNGQLVMWAHGFRGATRTLTVQPPGFGLREKLLEQGYAWAASSYYANDYDVRAGVRSTRALARHFARTVEKPRKTFIAGVSMGGHVTARSIEDHPGLYDAALPMCGVLGDHGLFDYFLDYQLAAQDLADIPAHPTPPNYQTELVPKIKETLGLTRTGPTNARGEQFRAIAVDRSGGQRPGDDAAFAYWQDYLFSLATPPAGGTLAQEPGKVATNLFTRYEPTEPVNINKTIERVRPTDPVARLTRRLTPVARISGRPHVPVMSLHNLGDMFVPFSMEQLYAKDVARRGRSELLVQRAIRSIGHCEFSPAEVGKAWDDLVRWERTGDRPAGDNVTRPGVVADPGYGCRFTDPAAYQTGTRPLYKPCP